MQVVDQPPFWLSSGDPGEFPEPCDEPAAGLWDGWDELPCAEGRVPSADVHWAVPGVPPATAGAHPLLLDLQRSLDELEAHGALSGSRADTGLLMDLSERARGLALRELAEMDAVGGHQRAGARTTTASWLRDRQHLTDAAARAAVRLATTLRDDLPVVGELLTSGQITREHAAAVTAGVHGLDRDVVREAQDALGALALVTDPVDLRTRLRDKAAAIDDRIAADAARRAKERMGLRLDDVGPHTAVDGTLAGDDGAIVRLAMDLAVEADRQDGDTRSRATRQADVLVQWARDSLTRHHGPGDSLADDAHTVRTYLHVLIRPEQLAPAGSDDPFALPAPRHFHELLQRDLAGAPPAAPMVAGDLSPLSRATLRRLACDATADHVVLPPNERNDPLYVGRASRLVTGRLFRALVARDRRCVVKGCRRRPAQCAAHHVRHWADGGTTDLDNLVLLCHQHHHDHHDRGLDLPHEDGRWLTQRGWSNAPP